MVTYIDQKHLIELTSLNQVSSKLNINHNLQTWFFFIVLQAMKQELSLKWISKYTIKLLDLNYSFFFLLFFYINPFYLVFWWILEYKVLQNNARDSHLDAHIQIQISKITRVIFAHRMALISDAMYKVVKTRFYFILFYFFFANKLRQVLISN